LRVTEFLNEGGHANCPGRETSEDFTGERLFLKLFR
jgi:hypothetical protein